MPGKSAHQNRITLVIPVEEMLVAFRTSTRKTQYPKKKISAFPIQLQEGVKAQAEAHCSSTFDAIVAQLNIFLKHENIIIFTTSDPYHIYDFIEFVHNAAKLDWTGRSM